MGVWTINLRRFVCLLAWAVVLGLGARAACADDLAAGLAALKGGNIWQAQTALRKTVRRDPHNAEAHYWLAWVSLELGDPVAAEREATAAQQRGYAPVPTLRLLGQAMLAQHKFAAVLNTLHPDGKDATYDAVVLVLQGYAQLGLNKPADAKAAFDAAQQKAPALIDPLLGASRLALTKRDLATATATVDRALALQPKAPEALLAKAQLLRMHGDPAAALAVLDDLLANAPVLSDLVQAHLDRAVLEIDLGRFDAAKADIDAVLKSTPASVKAIYLQAALAAQQKDYQRADAYLQRITLYLPQIPGAYFMQALVKERLGQLEQALAAARAFQTQAPSDIIGDKLVARIHLDQRRPDLAAAALNKLVSAGKADAETYELLGTAYAMGGRSDDAVRAFQQARSRAPANPDLQAKMAYLHMEMGDPFAAVADLQHVLDVAPKLQDVGEALFYATLATGDLRKTEDVLAQIKAAEGDSVTVQYLTAVLKQTQLDFDGARQLLAMITRFHPDYLPAWTGLAHLLALEGKPQEADQVLADLLRRHPTAEPALTLLVADDDHGNRKDDALALLQAAHAADSANMEILAGLGYQLITVGKPQAALDLLVQIKDDRVGSVPLQVMKAAAQQALGQKDQARDTLGQLLVDHPQELGVRQRLIDMLVAAGDYGSARNVIKDGLAAMPRTYPLLQAYVLLDLKEHGLDAALASADLLQSQDREFAPAHALRGDVYMAVNRPEDAAAAFAKALSEAPDTGLLSRLVAAQIRAGHLPAARAALLDWVRAHPDDLTALEELAQVDIGLDQLDEAGQALAAILAKKSYDPVALNNLAWIMHRRHDARALALAREAYLLSPDAQNADTLGWILTTGGRADLGVGVLRNAVAQSPNNPAVLLHYAFALRDTGDHAGALRLLTALAEIKADFPDKAELAPALRALQQAVPPTKQP